MYQIYFYKDKRGKEPVLDYLKELSQQKGKDSRIRLNKISDYLNILQEVGTAAGLPVLRHLERGDLGTSSFKRLNFICHLV